MYLRSTKRKNKDGSVVEYLQLAHNERHPDTRKPVANIIHNFGRADQLDRRRLTGRGLEAALVVAHLVEHPVGVGHARRARDRRPQRLRGGAHRAHFGLIRPISLASCAG